MSFGGDVCSLRLGAGSKKRPAATTVPGGAAGYFHPGPTTLNDHLEPLCAETAAWRRRVHHVPGQSLVLGKGLKKGGKQYLTKDDTVCKVKKDLYCFIKAAWANSKV